MKILYKWIKKHKPLSIFLLFLIFVVPPIMVSLLYNLPFDIPLLKKPGEAGDMLGYISGFESFLAATILSYLALWQTDRIQQEDDYKYQSDIKRPFFIIKQVSSVGPMRSLHYKKNCYYYKEKKSNRLAICLQNIGDGIATECHYTIKGKSPKNYKENDAAEYIPINEFYCIEIFPAWMRVDWNSVQYIIHYKNIVGFEYEQSIQIDFYHDATIPADETEDADLLYIAEVKNISSQRLVKNQTLI